MWVTCTTDYILSRKGLQFAELITKFVNQTISACRTRTYIRFETVDKVSLTLSLHRPEPS